MAESSTNNSSSGNTGQPSGSSKPDEQQLKTISAVGYLGILFLLPYLMYPKEKFAVFHANQSLILLIVVAAVNIVGGMIPFLGWFIVLPLGNLFVFVLFIIGLINALNGRMKRLPVVGGFDLLKVQE